MKIVNTAQNAPNAQIERLSGSFPALSNRGSRLGFWRGSVWNSFGSGLALAALVAGIGCGNQYRPVVSSINPVGPAGQASKYAVAISDTGSNSAGLLTIVDVFGDSVLVNANLGVGPQYLQLNSTGTTGYTLNSDTTINSFSISTSLITSQVQQSTLIAGANPVSLLTVGTNVYIAEAGRNSVAQLTGTPPALKQEIPTGAGTIYTVGSNSAVRVYALATGSGGGAGTATPIETSTNNPDTPITVGVNPIYGVMTADGRRAFVLNNGSNTVSVINAQTNALDTFPNAKGVTTSTIPVNGAPIWADFAPTLDEMVVVNQAAKNGNGTLNIISVPLCSSTAVSDPNCDASNPIDGAGFGSIVATIPVGVNPVMVAVLQDGTQAFVANQGNAALGIAGSVTIINLTTNTVTATLPALPSDTDLLDSNVHGHPSYIAATTGTPTGKVFVTATDSSDMTVIDTDIDAVDTHIALQGNGIAVRVSAP